MRGNQIEGLISVAIVALGTLLISAHLSAEDPQNLGEQLALAPAVSSNA